MTTIPCKRPKVDVVPHPSDVAGAWQTRCRVPGCDHVFNSVKTACQEDATRHRAEHRDAVPATTIAPQITGPGQTATCDCGARWVAPTKAHARTWLRHHLTLDHGLVECP